MGRLEYSSVLSLGIFDNLMKKCGIYAIEHVTSGRVYIGSSIDIADRWRQHRRALKSGTHHSVFLQRAWVKYGAETFLWYELETCSTEEMHAKETAWIAACSATKKDFGYNSSPTGGSCLGIKHSAEVCAKIKKAKSNISPETREKLSVARRARPPMSDESRKKLSLSNSQPRGPKSEETRRKISATLSGRKQDPTLVEKRAAAIRGRAQSAEMVERRAAKLRGQTRSPESRERMRQAALRRWGKINTQVNQSEINFLLKHQHILQP